MSNQDIISLKKEILTALTQKKVKVAIDGVRVLMASLQVSLFSDRLNAIETNYKYMLHYQFEGVEDPEQKNVYLGIFKHLYELADDVSDALLANKSTDLFFEKQRINESRGNTVFEGYLLKLKDLQGTMSLTELVDDQTHKISKKREVAIQIERTASDMFQMVYASSRSTSNDLNNYKAFINDKDVKEREKCLFISAFTLNLFHRFDANKLGFLMSCCSNKSVQLSQRAIVGLVVFLQMYDIRWEYYPECKQQFEALSENIYFKKSVITIIKQLIRSRETEKISKKLTDEIIPEMMKFNSLAGKKLNMDELMGLADDFSEKNPDWKKELESSGLADKLQEYSNLQMEGADVFHSTFSHLKSFPFFYDLSNWFLPFDSGYSELLDIFTQPGDNNLLYTAIIASGHMCNSDKYSFCLSLKQMPEMQRNMMLQQFGSESEELKQLQKEAMDINPSITDEVISNQYIQDLYRFFKLHPSKNNFFDVFRLDINFYNKKSISPLISDVNDMRQIAVYYFDKNFLSEALSVYSLIADIDKEDSGVFQKIGYCKQMINDTEGALNAYLKADLLKPNTSWTIRRIAQLYRSEKDYKLALDYYLKLQTLTPDNISVELNIGHCYLDLKDYEKALNTYFKVEMLYGNDNPKSWRPIAWTAFLLGKYELAQNYYQRILGSKATEHDYLNAGHTELALNNKKKALEYYVQTSKMLNNNQSEFQELFLADKEALLSLNIDESFFPLLFDEVAYKLKA